MTPTKPRTYALSGERSGGLLALTKQEAIDLHELVVHKQDKLRVFLRVFLVDETKDARWQRLEVLRDRLSDIIKPSR